MVHFERARTPFICQPTVVGDTARMVAMIKLTTLTTAVPKASVSTWNTALGHVDRYAVRFASGAERFDEELGPRR